jgi:hypothetical protein
MTVPIDIPTQSMDFQPIDFALRDDCPASSYGGNRTPGSVMLFTGAGFSSGTPTITSDVDLLLSTSLVEGPPIPNVILKSDSATDESSVLAMLDWIENAADSRAIALELERDGYHLLIDEAHGVASNFELVGQLIDSYTTHPYYVTAALDDGLMAKAVFTLAAGCHAYLRGFLSLRGRERRSTPMPTDRAFLRLILARLASYLAAVDMHMGRSRGHDEAPPSDSPRRAMPRETRAGPSSKEPSEPGEGSHACDRGEAPLLRPASDRRLLTSVDEYHVIAPHLVAKAKQEPRNG